MNRKRVWRPYVDEGLRIRNERPRRKVSATLRCDRHPPTAPNQIWSMDFPWDQLFGGSRIRIPAIVDAFSRLSPAIDVRRRYRGADVVDTLERVTEIYGTPTIIRLDDGPEFKSKELDLWARINGVTPNLWRPGTQTDNAFVESSNRKAWAEGIDRDWSLYLDHTRQECEVYGIECSEERPHGVIGNKTPAAFIKAIGQPSRPLV